MFGIQKFIDLHYSNQILLVSKRVVAFPVCLGSCKQHVSWGNECQDHVPVHRQLMLPPEEGGLQCLETEFTTVTVRGSEHPRGMPLVTRMAPFQAEQSRETQWHSSSVYFCQKTRTVPNSVTTSLSRQ
jgi:hypothetical protein